MSRRGNDVTAPGARGGAVVGDFRFCGGDFTDFSLASPKVLTIVTRLVLGILRAGHENSVQGHCKSHCVAAGPKKNTAKF